MMLLLTPVATFLITIWACGNIAPDISVTVPERVAPTTCAETGVHISRLNARPANAKRMYLNFRDFLRGSTVFLLCFPLAKVLWLDVYELVPFERDILR